MAILDMKLAIDVAYHHDAAIAGGILFERWQDHTPAREITVRIPFVAAYVPDRFYRRELPCILKLLENVPEPLETIVVDGHVYLETEENPGLGMHLHRALFEQIPVIGVAKNAFENTPSQTEVYRGPGKRPLYMTAVGNNEAVARQYIASMADAHRIPILLKLADQLCRGLTNGGNT